MTELTGKRISAGLAKGTAFVARDILEDGAAPAHVGAGAPPAGSELARSVLRRLQGAEGPAFAAMPAGSILVTQRLLPSDVVALSRADVGAILVESLGPGSHAALLAREKSIPVVAELPGLGGLRNGDELLVDAFL